MAQDEIKEKPDSTITKQQRARICDCNECFYCYINQEHFHAHNLEKLKESRLMINVAEYVGAETSAPVHRTTHIKLKDIPIVINSSLKQ